MNRLRNIGLVVIGAGLNYLWDALTNLARHNIVSFHWLPGLFLIAVGFLTAYHCSK